MTRRELAIAYCRIKYRRILLRINIIQRYPPAIHSVMMANHSKMTAEGHCLYLSVYMNPGKPPYHKLRAQPGKRPAYDSGNQQNRKIAHDRRSLCDADSC